MTRMHEVVTVSLALLIAACGGGGGGGAPEGPANTIPTASAGPAQYVQTGSTVTLVATASDADGDPLTYEWSLRAEQPGIAPSLSNPTSPTASFVADTYRPGAAYTATVKVSDGKASTTASVPIVATQAGLTLIEVDYYGHGAETPVNFPYVRRPTQKITTSDEIVTLAKFKLVVQGPGQFTIQNLRVGLSAGGIVPSFSGLADGQTIVAGPPVEFALQSTHTRGSTVYTMNYQFEVAENSDGSFDYRSTLTTN